jgi:hypothetical protein
MNIGQRKSLAVVQTKLLDSLLGHHKLMAQLTSRPAQSRLPETIPDATSLTHFCSFLATT